MIRPVLARGEAPAAHAAIFFVLGIFLGAWSSSGTTAAIALIAVGGAGLAGRRASRVRGLAFGVFWWAAGFAIGRERIAVPAREARATFLRFSPPAEGAVALEGVLADFWTGRPPRAHTTMRAERVRCRGAWRPFPAEVVVFVSGESPVAPLADRGDRVRLVGHLEREDIPASEREIDLPWPVFRVSVKSARLIERTGTTAASWLSWPNRRLFAPLAARAGRDAAFERDVRGPVSALILGRTSELDRGMVARYRRGGLYHLLVISGLHVVLETGLVLFALRVAGMRGRPRDVLLLLLLFFFVLLGGANPPAVRAGLVVGALVATRLLERPIAGAQAIGLSALLLFLAAPEQIFSVGTVLTFSAVGGIALFSRPIRARLPKRPEWLFGGFAVALAAECATAPTIFWRFNLVAAGAWVTAPLSIPLSVGLIALGAAVLACEAAGLPAGPFADLFALGSRGLELLAEGAAGIALLRPTPALWAVGALGALLAASAFAPPRFRGACALAAAAVFLALALRRGPAGPARGFSIEALDVGQGDAILLRWKRRAILIDGGGPFDLQATDFGRTRLLPKLLDRGVTRLDAVVLSHPHPDHALGLFSVLEELPVAELRRAASEDDGDLFARLDAVASRRGIPVRPLSAGDVLSWDDARLFVLHAGGVRRKTDGVNNQSVVAVFERGGRTALLTGDAGVPTEADLLARGWLHPVDVLKVGHHGSRTATGAGLLDAVRPKVALLSCGRRNRFGHPAPEALSTLSRFCVPVMRTDLRSDVRVELDPDRTLVSWRGAEARW